MPHYVIARLMESPNTQGKTMKDSRVLVLGVAYKPDIGDARESPGITLIAEMQQRGALVDYNDPHVPRLPKQRQFDLRLESVDLTADSLSSYDCVLIATAHTTYDYPFIVRRAQLVIDTRNATKDVQEHRTKILHA